MSLVTISVTKPSPYRFCKALIFAPSGHGKTYLLGTANDDERTTPMLLLSYEGGTSSLVGRDIDVVEVRDWDKFDEVYAQLKAGGHPYKSVGIDSGTEVQVFTLLNQLDTSTRNRAIPDLLEQGDYGISLTQMRRLLRKFRDLPMHVFVTALASESLEAGVGTVKIPSFAGRLADEAPGIFDVVAYLALGSDEETGAITRTLVLQNYPKFKTKVRGPMNIEIPDAIANPTVSSLLDALQIKAKE